MANLPGPTFNPLYEATMDAFFSDNFPLHVKVKQQENTDEALIGAFWLKRGEYQCATFNTTMTREGCAGRKAEAREKEKEGGYNILAKCLECKGVEKMEKKKCHVEGCGRKVLAKGMCSTHYFRAREAEKKAEEKKKIDENIKANAIALAPTPHPNPKQPDPPKEPDPPKPTKKPNGTKRVNVQFVGPDVALWEQLRARARKARRDIRVEALCIIEDALAPKEEPEVYS